MNAEQLTVSSVTGVDVEFEIAGPGSRSYAFVIDWHIRFIVAVAWFITAVLILNGGWTLAVPKGNDKAVVLFVVLPALAIYFFYHPILEIMTRGRTPGKRIAGVRIVTREGDVPTVGALLIRNLLRVVDSLPAFYLVGLAATLFTKQHVRIGDLAAGTLLVFDHDREAKSLQRFDQLARYTHIDPQIAELIDELLQRWTTLDDDHRSNIAAKLLERLGQGEARRLAMLHEKELQARLQQALEGKS